MDDSLENEQVEAVRQKRKQRIMANSQKRMNAILNMNGEKRQAPCVDGIGLSNSSNNPDTQSQMSRVPSHPKIKEPLDFEDDALPIKPKKLISTTPKYMEFIDKQRFWISLLIGVLLASLTLFFNQIGNLILPTLLLTLSYEALTFQTRKALSPKQNTMLNTFLPEGLNMERMTDFGLIVDVFRRTVVDLLFAAFGFISSRIFLESLNNLIVTNA